MADLVGEQLVERPAAAHHLAAHQVQGLDAVGAFVDLGDAHVAHQLLLAPLANVAMAAEHLLAMHGHFQAQIGGESPAAFVQCLHGQQHAPHIGVHDDRVGSLVLGLGP
uniref:Uncharacterized protein n=1 Tax=Steinernema glaseri TaxID=37863 RepID=A0A1I7YBA0_9BILA